MVEGIEAALTWASKQALLEDRVKKHAKWSFHSIL